MEEIPQVVSLVDEAIRVSGARTSSRDDFPLAVSEENLDGIYIASEQGSLAACLVSLVRPLRTSVGRLDVAGLGSVVTREEFRGRGLSGTLQAQALEDLGKVAQLAVLWTDEPKYYLGRGFRPAGVEYHVNLESWRDVINHGTEGRVRQTVEADTPAIESLFDGHPWRTLRRPGESGRLYGMPGTTGFVLEQNSEIAAYAFISKGSDFCGWAHEWGGPPDVVATLLAVLREENLLNCVLVPQGGDGLKQLLQEQGAGVIRSCCGMWTILDREVLADVVRQSGYEGELPEPGASSSAWLGEVLPSGEVRKGLIEMAIWGFDSV